MSILFHLTVPRPPQPELDAVVQEVEALKAGFGGEIVHLNPSQRPGSLYPERLYGLHRLLYLRRQETTIQLHHVYNSHLFYFPYMKWLQRPIVYSVTAGLRPQRPGALKGLRRLAAIVVSSERDRTRLFGWGLKNVNVVQPGIDVSRFDPVPPPPDSGFTLLAGSAPWSEAQFHSKGVEALLAAAKARSDLRLVFLWRGVLFEEMQARVAQYGLEDRVEVINEWVDVNEVLARVHAAVVLADDPTLVKAFPHSLLEALAVGRPVLVSRALPMADYVDDKGCGQVVAAVSPREVLKALAQLEARYEICQAAASEAGKDSFSKEALVESYGQLYLEYGSGK
jgi:glycosyltransferase involved in cell wall biosynthesis